MISKDWRNMGYGEYVSTVNTAEGTAWAEDFSSGLGAELGIAPVPWAVAQTGGMVMVPYFYLRTDSSCYLSVSPPRRWLAPDSRIDDSADIIGRDAWVVMVQYDYFDRSGTVEDYWEEQWVYTAPPELEPREAGRHIARLLPFSVPDRPELGTLYPGQQIEYDVYSEGTHIPAMASPLGPIALSDSGPTWNLVGTDPLCKWAAVQDVRLGYNRAFE